MTGRTRTRLSTLRSRGGSTMVRSSILPSGDAVLTVSDVCSLGQAGHVRAWLRLPCFCRQGCVSVSFVARSTSNDIV